MYGSELWGFQQFGVLEKAHMFACKRYLNVNPQTPNNMIFGDLGRYPLYVTSAVRCVKYWLRIMCLSEERLPRKAYNMLNHLQELGKKTWAYHIRQLLCTNGFGEVWLQQNVGDTNNFLSVFRQRLSDQFQQDWHSNIESKERFELYASFKQVVKSETYLECNQLRCFKEAYIKFRFGISPILVHRLRYRKDVLPRHLLCPACKYGIEDEAHILFECKVYKEFRSSVDLLVRAHGNITQVMSAEDEEAIRQLSRFLYRCLQKRKEFTV